MTLIQLKGLDQYTYVDSDGIVKQIEVDGNYTSEGFIDDYEFVETQVIAFPWLHNFKTWLFRTEYHGNPDIVQCHDLPF